MPHRDVLRQFFSLAGVAGLYNLCAAVFLTTKHYLKGFTDSLKPLGSSRGREPWEPNGASPTAAY